LGSKDFFVLVVEKGGFLVSQNMDRQPPISDDRLAGREIGKIFESQKARQGRYTFGGNKRSSGFL